MGGGCSGSALVRPETLCFPSVCSVGKMPLKIGAGTGEGINADVPLCHNQTWFTTLLTTIFLSVFKDHHKPNGRDIPIDRAKQPAPWHLQSFQDRYLGIKEIQINLSELFW